ncbi:MAG: phage/plasmid primase, P4 family [Isosphaeraceae bacterium]
MIQAATCLDTALELLHRLKLWPVAIKPGEKAPIGESWGSTRPTEQTIRETFKRFPKAGLGLLLGPEASIIDIECDGPEGEHSLAMLMGGEIVLTLGWSSARGPHHVFRYDARLARYGKSIIKLPELPGLEIRIGGNGKQLQSNCPPTIGIDGKPREWNGTLIVADLPEAVFSFLDAALLAKPKAQARVVTPGPPPPSTSARDAYVAKALEDECQNVACAPMGSRNETLNKASFSLGQLVGAGVLDRACAERRLTDAAHACGLSDHELAATLRSGLDAGLGQPRDLSHLDTDRNGRHKTAQHGAPTGPPPRGPVEATDDPVRLARIALRDHQHEAVLTLRRYRGEWLNWVDSAYRPKSDEAIEAVLLAVCKREFDQQNQHRDENQKPRKVSKTLVANVAMAMRSLTMLDDRVEAPAWLIGEGECHPFSASAADILPCRNALVHLPTLLKDPANATVKPTPQFFSTYALDYDFDPGARKPETWYQFLDDLWGEDQENKDTLQEWFGYCLALDTTLQKILALIGPKRSGKGTIARVQRALIGHENVAGPTLSGLTQNFGLAPLIGKPLAIISDARLSGRSDAAIIVERLLSISGEDTLTVDRKHRDSWTGKLPTRIVLISNELPRLHDSSGALASRLIILRLTKSFYNIEDRTLFSRLVLELPGILRWAIEGWRRLRDRGHLIQPETGKELVAEMENLSSPVGAFVAEKCNVWPGSKVGTKELYAAWWQWCEDNGRKEPGDAQHFGRNLRAAVPAVHCRQTRGGGVPVRLYCGIELATPDGSATHAQRVTSPLQHQLKMVRRIDEEEREIKKEMQCRVTSCARVTHAGGEPPPWLGGRRTGDPPRAAARSDRSVSSG